MRAVATCVAVALAASTVAAIGFGFSSAAAADGGAAAGTYAAGTYAAVTPTTVLAPVNAAAGAQLSVAVAGKAGVPATVGAVAINVTTWASQPGPFTIWADGTARPAFAVSGVAGPITVAHWSKVSTLAISRVGSNGRVLVLNGSSAAVQFQVDVLGYYQAGAPSTPGAFAAVAPARVLGPPTGVGSPRSTIGSNQTLTVKVSGAFGLPLTGAGSVAINIAATGSTVAGGSVTAWGTGVRPSVANLSYPRGATATGLAIVPIGADGTIHLYNTGPNPVDVTADAVGYFVAGVASQTGAVTPVATTRIVDTPTGVGLAKQPVAPSSTVAIAVAGHGGIPATNAREAFLAINATSSSSAGTGPVTIWSSGTRPTISNLTVSNGSAANIVVVPIAADGTVRIYNGSTTALAITVDALAYTRTTSVVPPTPTPTPTRTTTSPMPTPTPTTTAPSSSAPTTPAPTTPAPTTSAPTSTPTPPSVWTASTALLPADADVGPSGFATSTIWDSACPSDDYCISVGTYNSKPIDSRRPLIDVLSNGTWSNLPVVLPAGLGGTDSTLWGDTTSVSCSAPGNCVAVGDAFVLDPSNLLAPRHQVGLIVTISGSTATATYAPLPAGVATSVSPELTQVSCSTSGWCGAIGYYTTPDFTIVAFVATLTDGQWTAATPPTLAGSINSYRQAISCFAPASCVISGGQSIPGQPAGSPQSVPLVATLKSGVWSLLTTPLPTGETPGYSPELEPALQCSAIDSCQLLTTYSTQNAAPPLSYALNGSTLTLQPFAEPSSSLPVATLALGSMSCPSADSCVLMATSTDPVTKKSSYGVEVLANGQWTYQSLPNPSGIDVSRLDLGSIYCGAPGSCLALANLYDVSSPYTARPLVETLSGGNWTAVIATDPSGAQANPGGGLTCSPSGHTCLDSWIIFIPSPAGGAYAIFGVHRT